MQHARIFSIYLRVMLLAVFSLLVCTGALAADQYTVVIDAGHGGKDIGAADNGVQEKDVNLAVALKTGEMIKKLGKNVKVVYTRDKDEYLTLQQRADKANKSKGDLFISIHTNSVDKSNPNRTTVAGSSVYTLGLHKGDNNMAVARRENAVMTLEPNFENKYSGFDPNADESYIIFEMAQKANMAQSAKFAEMVQKQLTQSAGRRDRGVHQAGFWVLWATSMPSVLVELDFVCNPTSAQYISSSDGQKKMAGAIANAASAYFKALAQHNQSRMRAQEQEAAEPAAPVFADAGQGVVLAAAPQKAERTDAAPAAPSRQQAAPGQRRRRSEASRKKSESQVYAEAVIREDESYIVAADAITTEEPATEPTTPQKQKSGKKDKKKNRTKDKKAPKKEVQLASASTPKKAKSSPAKEDPKAREKALRRANATSQKMAKSSETNDKATGRSGAVHARLAKKDVVYKIQLFASADLLTAGDEQFHGLGPVTCIPDQGTYKYVYGESASREEINSLLTDVKRIIPEATVIQVRRSAPARASR